MASESSKTYEAHLVIKGVFEGADLREAVDMTEALEKHIRKIKADGGIKVDVQNLKDLQKAAKKIREDLGLNNKGGKGAFGGIFDGFKGFDGKSIFGLTTSIGALIIGIKSLKDAIIQAYGLFKNAERIKADLIRSGYTKAEAESAYQFVREIPTANNNEGLNRNVEAYSYLVSKKNLTGGKDAIEKLVQFNSVLSDFSTSSLAYSGDLQSTVERLSVFSKDLNRMAEIMNYSADFNKATGESFENYLKLVEQMSEYSLGKASPKEMFESATRAMKGFGTYAEYDKIFGSVKGFTSGSELGKTLQALLSANGKPFHSFEKMMEYYGGDVNKVLEILLETINSASAKGNLTGAQNIALKDLILSPMDLKRANTYLSKEKFKGVEARGVIENAKDFLSNMPNEVRELEIQRIKRGVGTKLTKEGIPTKTQYQNMQASSGLGAYPLPYENYVEQYYRNMETQMKKTKESVNKLFEGAQYQDNRNINIENTFNIQNKDPKKTAVEFVLTMDQETRKAPVMN
jgi:hypothetical protein